MITSTSLYDLVYEPEFDRFVPCSKCGAWRVFRDLRKCANCSTDRNVSQTKRWIPFDRTSVRQLFPVYALVMKRRSSHMHRVLGYPEGQLFDAQGKIAVQRLSNEATIMVCIDHLQHAPAEQEQTAYPEEPPTPQRWTQEPAEQQKTPSTETVLVEPSKVEQALLEAVNVVAADAGPHAVYSDSAVTVYVERNKLEKPGLARAVDLLRQARKLVAELGGDPDAVK